MRSLRLVTFCVLGAALFAAIAIFVVKRCNYEDQRDALAQSAKQGPVVRTVVAKRGASEKELSLIGEARPYAEVTLYAKVSGYLREVYVDKGDSVKKGQILARIESPETDKTFAGVTADASNKRAIANRMKALRAQSLISAQEAQQADTEARVAEAQRDSMGVIKGYEELKAPFDGVVTARFADAGALVQSAASSQTSALPLVRVSDVSRLRVNIFLDQKDASSIKRGDPVEIRVDENPGDLVKATITRVTHELDPNTRMLLAEIELDNAKRTLVPGSFVRVDLTTHKKPLIEIPSDALVYQQGKNQVAVVESNKLRYRDVVLHSNDGRVASIASGLKEGEVVALGVGTTLIDNSPVRPIATKR